MRDFLRSHHKNKEYAQFPEQEQLTTNVTTWKELKINIITIIKAQNTQGTASDNASIKLFSNTFFLFYHKKLAGRRQMQDRL